MLDQKFQIKHLSNLLWCVIFFGCSLSVLVNFDYDFSSVCLGFQAYSLHDREVGYCQGSGFIVGLLLMQVSIRVKYPGTVFSEYDWLI